MASRKLVGGSARSLRREAKSMMPPRVRPGPSHHSGDLRRPSALAACGSEGISVPEDDPAYRGAVLFSQRCSGCHTLTAAGYPGLGQPGAAQPGAEPRPAHRDARRRAVRDPQRRLLGRDHAPEHRRRARRPGRRRVRLQVRGQRRSTARPRRASTDSGASGRRATSSARPAPCSTCAASVTIRPRAGAALARRGAADAARRAAAPRPAPARAASAGGGAAGAAQRAPPTRSPRPSARAPAPMP